MLTLFRAVAALAYLGVIASVVLAGLFWFAAMAGATGAPQEASGSAMALVMIVAPYCVARSLGEIVEIARPRPG